MSRIELSGSCLCGAVKYVIKGETKRFYQCQCKRCRKSGGAGSASNLLITPKTSITWSSGESFMVRYKAIRSSDYCHKFCLQCGSSMPQTLPTLDAVLVPLGSLDTEADDSLSSNMFGASHMEWICFYEMLEYAES